MLRVISQQPFELSDRAVVQAGAVAALDLITTYGRPGREVVVGTAGTLELELLNGETITVPQAVFTAGHAYRGIFRAIVGGTAQDAVIYL